MRYSYTQKKSSAFAAGSGCTFLCGSVYVWAHWGRGYGHCPTRLPREVARLAGPRPPPPGPQCRASGVPFARASGGFHPPPSVYTGHRSFWGFGGLSSSVRSVLCQSRCIDVGSGPQEPECPRPCTDSASAAQQDLDRLQEVPWSSLSSGTEGW